MKIKIFKKEKNFKKQNHELNINFFWELAVCFMCAVAISSLFFGSYMFMNINKESNSASENIGEQAKASRQERIKRVLEYFSFRREKSEQIINSPSPIADPS